MHRTSLVGVAAGVLLLSSSVLVAPAAAQSGGASPTPATPTTPAPAPAPAPPAGAPATGTQTATTPGLGTWKVRGVGYTGRTITASGTLAASLRGTTVELQRRTGSTWVRAARARVGRSGRVAVRWRTGSARTHELRLVRAGQVAATARSTEVPSVQVTVYDRIIGTWYGPGFYGKRTACGQTMSATLVGVAHRTLPCGTQVEVARGSKVITVPVVDRGPFANDATIDLTAAAADMIGKRATLTLGLRTRRDLPRARG